jgi:hypothetical protein
LNTGSSLMASECALNCLDCARVPPSSGTRCSCASFATTRPSTPT